MTHYLINSPNKKVRPVMFLSMMVIKVRAVTLAARKIVPDKTWLPRPDLAYLAT